MVDLSFTSLASTTLAVQTFVVAMLNIKLFNCYSIAQKNVDGAICGFKLTRMDPCPQQILIFTLFNMMYIPDFCPFGLAMSLFSAAVTK